MIKKAVFIGSFNPITIGHVNLIERALKLCQELVVGIYAPVQKSKGDLSVEARVKLAKKALEGFQHVEVQEYSGLGVEFAQSVGADVMIRGVRDVQDFSYEIDLAAINEQLASLETIWIKSAPHLQHVRSSWARDLMRFSPQNLYKLIPEKILPDLLQIVDSNAQ